jgi:hypothetical protein
LNRKTAGNRSIMALGLAILLTAAAVPAYAIADGIQRAPVDRPDRDQIGQPRLPSADELVRSFPTSLLRRQDVHLQTSPDGPSADEPPSVRKLPGRLAP